MTGNNWLLLITNLPGRNQALRMRVWRALKAGGAGMLRDGVYVLPDSAHCRALLDEQARQISAGRGGAHVLSFQSDNTEQQQTLEKLFDRSAEYGELLGRVDKLLADAPKRREPAVRRQLAELQREAAALIATDILGGPARDQMQGRLLDAELTLNRRYAVDEPSAVAGNIPHRDRRNYRARTWSTRQHLWIDRVCSAWLIRRFIDPRARFVWLKRPTDLPSRAVGFDFDGAEFTHVGSRVTFEVLVASFGLDSDTALLRLGSVVHYLDVGGIPVAEAAGLAAVVTGARATHSGDDALLAAVTPTLDSLYAAFGTS